MIFILFGPGLSRSATVTVQPGNTLRSIARKYFDNDHLRWIDIYNLNKDKISNPQRIAVGLVLTLPDFRKPTGDSPVPNNVNALPVQKKRHPNIKRFDEMEIPK